MAIRLRMVGDIAVAICAAHSEPKPDDIYLDDKWHYAISQKYWRDYDEIDIVDEDNNVAARGECDCPSCREAGDR